MAPWPYPRWIAHRGAGKLAPENTLAAFRLGAAHGYRMFECDAKLSADGVVFLMHDATLQRTTNARERIGTGQSAVGGEYPWHTLSQLDAGGWHSRAYAGEPLPTLEAIASFCIRNGYFLNIEIKPTPGTEQHTGEAVAREAGRPVIDRRDHGGGAQRDRTGEAEMVLRLPDTKLQPGTDHEVELQLNIYPPYVPHLKWVTKVKKTLHAR